MGEIVNLRRVRKARARAEAVKGAEVNRVAFGRSKAEKALSTAKAAAAALHLDGHRLDGAEPSDTDDSPPEA